MSVIEKYLIILQFFFLFLFISESSYADIETYAEVNQYCNDRIGENYFKTDKEKLLGGFGCKINQNIQNYKDAISYFSNSTYGSSNLNNQEYKYDLSKDYYCEALAISCYKGNAPVMSEYDRYRKRVEAIKKLDNAILLKSKFAYAYYLRAELKHDLGWITYDDEKKAKEACNDSINDFKKYIEIIKNNPRSYVDLARAQECADKFDEAITSYDKAISIESNNSEKELYRRFRSTALFNAGKFLEYIEYKNEMIEKTPDNSSDYYKRGEAYFKTENYKKAIKDFTKFIELYPKGKPIIGIDKHDGYVYRAKAKYKIGEYNEALDDLDAAIELTDWPNYDALLYRYYIKLYHLNDYAGALIDLNKLIDKNPNNAQFYLDRAEIYFNLGNAKKEIKDKEKLIELDPLSAENYYRSAATKKYYGDIDGAIKDLTTIINKELEGIEGSYCRTSKKDYAEAYSKRGKLRLKQGEMFAACLDFYKARELGNSCNKKLIKNHCDRLGF